MNATSVRARLAVGYGSLGAIALLAFGLTGCFVAGLYVLDELALYVPSPSWAIGWYALAFYLSWWIVYYRTSLRPGPDDDALTDEACVDLPECRIATLRTFLTYNTPRGRHPTNGADLADKARGTISTVGVIVGFSLLIFSFTVQILFGESPAHREWTIFVAVLGIQLVAIANFLIAIDSLDTTLNEFETFSDEMVHAFRQRFYDRGIAGYYRGLTLLVFSMFLLTMVVQPLLTVVGVAAFAYYGHSYWFGYRNYV